MSMFAIVLAESSLLWGVGLACHGALQPAWLRRQTVQPAISLQQWMKRLRVFLPLLALILAVALAGGEGLVAWIASAGPAGVLVALALSATARKHA
ncbi:hypothetical protein AA0472_1549 [Acetobacter estunensis NRIC 0472]|uniref:DUF3325 domain-containing protein n=1 Tax=Acetobacter estunensis TaxID=104097 RepID=A0A967ECP3_9PROT|nr:hypothetical protein [Acetobacter estunensis]NHO53140.1 hypothetical protein [Acetobacter estunensis]GBQ24830.1 hypothetical protein AA0472_1549 [Acetobacter estunensis NRIC 0472]